MEASTPLLVFPWLLVQLRALILLHSLSCIWANAIISSTYLNGLSKVLSSSQCLYQSCHFALSEGEFEPSWEKSIEKCSLDHSILYSRDQDDLIIEPHYILLQVLPFHLLNHNKVIASLLFPLSYHELGIEQLC